MAFLIQSLTAPSEAGSIPEENTSHRLQKYFGKNSQSQACATSLHLQIRTSSFIMDLLLMEWEVWKSKSVEVNV